jgi:Ca2+-binding EF-hand superfamily protein
MTTRTWIAPALAVVLGTGLVAAPALAQPRDDHNGRPMMHDRDGHGSRGGHHGMHEGRGYHGKGGQGGGMMRRLDANGDGTISEQEFTDPAGARFEAMDENGDGQLTAEEVAAHAERMRAARRTARAEAMIERLDADGDGAVTLEEMRAPHDRAAMFERMDADGDGQLSAEEMRSARHGGPGMDADDGSTEDGMDAPEGDTEPGADDAN